MCKFPKNNFYQCLMGNDISKSKSIVKRMSYHYGVKSNDDLEQQIKKEENTLNDLKSKIHKSIENDDLNHTENLIMNKIQSKMMVDHYKEKRRNTVY